MRSSTSWGATPDRAASRRHDLRAYDDARRSARSELAALLLLLGEGSDPRRVAEAAKATYRVVGLLWETAARLDDP